MLRYICKIAFTFLLTVALFAVGKIAFMLCHLPVYRSFGLSQAAAAIGHGLPMDCTMAGYISVIPALLAIARLWTSSRLPEIAEKIYFIIISLLAGTVLVIDAAQMARDGFAFFLSENGIWQTEQVPFRYVKEEMRP